MEPNQITTPNKLGIKNITIIFLIIVISISIGAVSSYYLMSAKRSDATSLPKSVSAHSIESEDVKIGNELQATSTKKETSTTMVKYTGALNELTRDKNDTQNGTYNIIPGWDIDNNSDPRDIIDVYPDGNVITRKEVGLHATISDCWITYNKRAYNITTLMPHEDLHPSIKVMKLLCGSDITSIVNTAPVVPGSISTARVKYALSYLYVGDIKD